MGVLYQGSYYIVHVRPGFTRELVRYVGRSANKMPTGVKNVLARFISFVMDQPSPSPLCCEEDNQLKKRITTKHRSSKLKPLLLSSDRSRPIYHATQVQFGAEKPEDRTFQVILYNIPTRPGWSRMVSYQVLRLVSLLKRRRVSLYAKPSMISVEARATFACAVE